MPDYIEPSESNQEDHEDSNPQVALALEELLEELPRWVDPDYITIRVNREPTAQA